MTKLWNLPVLRLIATDRCRVAAPWFAWSQGLDTISLLRLRANELERRRLGVTHALEQIIGALIYLPLSLTRIIMALHRWGRSLRATDHIPYGRQFLQLCVCAWRYDLRPQVYYYLRLHDQRRRESWHQIIDPSELHHLQREISPSDIEPLEDKLLFAFRATAAGIPVVPLLAVWRHGRLISAPDESGQSLCRNLFVKRTSSYSSAGVTGFRYDPLIGAHHDSNRRYSRAELDATLEKMSANVTLLVQPWLQNHPDLHGFSTVALCNYRIVTGRSPGGKAEVLLASLRFPFVNELTCAEKDTTLCAAVDLSTGRLHAAESKNPRIGRLVKHPRTNQQIEGFVVPRWQEMIDLVTKAHAAWSEFPFIGWDLSDTSDGLLFLEGSCLWGGFLAQMSGNRPLGLTPFGRIYQSQLAHRADSRSCPVLVNI